MDTRPWRLKHNSFLSTVNWYDVDFPVITELKCKLLHRAHAQTDRTDSQTPATPSSSTPSCDAGASAAPPPNPNSPELLSGPAHPGSMSVMQDTAACSAADSNTVHAHTVQASSISFPLQTASWTAVPLDLADDSLSAALLAAGLNPFIPTIWCEPKATDCDIIDEHVWVVEPIVGVLQCFSFYILSCIQQVALFRRIRGCRVTSSEWQTSFVARLSIVMPASTRWFSKPYQWKCNVLESMLCT